MAQHTRELFANLVRREVRGRYKGSWLGVVWTLANPLVAMLVYTLVFTVIWSAIPLKYYSFYLLVGQAFWVFFSGSLLVASTSIVGNADLVKKVSFPRQIVPLASVTSQGLTAGVMLVVLIPVSLLFARNGHAPLLLMPLVVVCCVALVTGLSLAIAGINVYFRDAEHILSALLLPWFFLTPILFTFDSFPLDKPWLVDVLKVVNFPTPFVLALQDVLYWGLWPSPGIVAYIVVVGFGALAGGWWLFNRLQRDFAVEL